MKNIDIWVCWNALTPGILDKFRIQEIWARENDNKTLIYMGGVSWKALNPNEFWRTREEAVAAAHQKRMYKIAELQAEIARLESISLI